MVTRKPKNIYGRRWGRGARPYLLMIKIVFVATLIGGLVSLLALVLLPAKTASIEARQAYADALHRAYAYVIIPSLVGAMVAGLALLASAWRALLRMRWLQLKLSLIVALVPILHAYMRSHSLSLQALAAQEQPDPAALATAHHQILAGTVAVLVFALLTATLGRVKPRLGQDYGRTFTHHSSPITHH
jgi:uncharacterized membrane protein